MSDNRDTLMKIGKLIAADDIDAARDAVHIAVIPMVAQSRLLPGTNVNPNGLAGGRCIGIVDPFLKTFVDIGETFWCFLFPGSITSLRHVWTHPEFPDVAPEPRRCGPRGEPINVPNTNDEAREWLRWYAESLDLTYRQLMEGAEEWVAHEDYLCGGSNLEGERTSEEFWRNFEIVTKTAVPAERRSNFFTCSC